jgi:hypothetical protein
MDQQNGKPLIVIQADIQEKPSGIPIILKETYGIEVYEESRPHR